MQPTCRLVGPGFSSLVTATADSPDNVLCLIGIELIAAFYGCLYAGCIPVTVRPPHAQNLTATLPTVRMVVDVSACLFPFQNPHSNN